jgi:hypothetical protein
MVYFNDKCSTKILQVTSALFHLTPVQSLISLSKNLSIRVRGFIPMGRQLLEDGNWKRLRFFVFWDMKPCYLYTAAIQNKVLNTVTFMVAM